MDKRHSWINNYLESVTEGRAWGRARAMLVLIVPTHILPFRTLHWSYFIGKYGQCDMVPRLLCFIAMMLGNLLHKLWSMNHSNWICYQISHQFYAFMWFTMSTSDITCIFDSAKIQLWYTYYSAMRKLRLGSGRQPWNALILVL